MATSTKALEILHEVKLRKKQLDELYAFLPHINPENGDENCVYCTLSVDNILRNGLPKDGKIPAASTERFPIGAFLDHRANILARRKAGRSRKRSLKTVLRSYINHPEFNERFKVYTAEERIDLSLDTEIIEIDFDTTQKESKKWIKLFRVHYSELVDHLKDSAIPVRKGIVGESVPEFLKEGVAFGMVFSSNKNPEEDGHMFHWIRYPNGNLYFLDAQGNDDPASFVTTTLPKDFTQFFAPHVFYLCTTPPEGFKITIKAESNKDKKEQDELAEEELKVKKESVLSAATSHSQPAMEPAPVVLTPIMPPLEPVEPTPVPASASVAPAPTAATAPTSALSAPTTATSTVTEPVSSLVPSTSTLLTPRVRPLTTFKPYVFPISTLGTIGTPTTASYAPTITQVSIPSPSPLPEPSYLLMQKRTSPQMATPPPLTPALLAPPPLRPLAPAPMAPQPPLTSASLAISTPPIAPSTASMGATSSSALPSDTEPYLTQYLEGEQLQPLWEKNKRHILKLRHVALGTPVNPFAKVNYAVCLRMGIGIARDLETAQRILSEMAPLTGSKNAYALCELSFLLKDHFPDQKSRAEDYEREAIALKCPRALTAFGRTLLKNDALKKAETQFKKALKEDKNYAPALYELGLLYFRTEFPAKPTEALKLLEQAAEYGHMKAQGYLMDMYLNGKEITLAPFSMKIGQNLEKVHYYWELLAKQSRNALYDLGRLYLTGSFKFNNSDGRPSVQITTPVDIKRGVDFMRKAASFGHVEAAKYLAEEIKKQEEALETVKSNLLLLGASLGKAPIVQRYAPPSLPLTTISSEFPLLKRPIEDPLREHLFPGDLSYGLKGLSREAFETLKREAESPLSRNTFAKCNYGTCLRDGIHTPRDTARAMELFKEAETLGDSMGITKIGICFANGFGVPKDISKAVTYFTRAINLENTTAMRWLALLYINGAEGVVKNVDFGVMLLRRAVALKDTEAMKELGTLYLEGNGIARDIKQAIALYEQAVALGDTFAMRLLGESYMEGGKGLEKNVEKGLEYLRKAVALKNSLAMVKLGCRYERDDRGVKKDLALMIKLYREAAQLENVQAFTNLGHCYKNGNGVTKNILTAMDYFKQAIKIGKPNDSAVIDAHYELGMIFYSGAEHLFPYRTENKEHLKLALEHISIAAKNGHVKAKERMKDLQDEYEETSKKFNTIDESLLLFHPLLPPRLSPSAVPMPRPASSAPEASSVPSLGVSPAPASGISSASVVGIVPASVSTSSASESSSLSSSSSFSSAPGTFVSSAPLDSSSSSSSSGFSAGEGGGGGGGLLLISSPLKRKEYQNGTAGMPARSDHGDNSDDSDVNASQPKTKKQFLRAE